MTRHCHDPLHHCHHRQRMCSKAATQGNSTDHLLLRVQNAWMGMWFTTLRCWTNCRGHAIIPARTVCMLLLQHELQLPYPQTDNVAALACCCATGFLGATGRGTEEHCGLAPGSVHIINSTLGKALGGATGGYTAASRAVVDMLRQRARPYLFSNTVAPPVVGASLAVFDLLASTTDLRDKLEWNTAYFRSQMTSAGFDIVGGSHPIVPIMLGDAALATRMASVLLDRGVYVVGFSYPVVPKGKARIRVQLSAAHTKAQLDTAVAAFKKVGRELGVLRH